MNELKWQAAKRKGQYTPDDMLEILEKRMKDPEAQRIMVIVQYENNNIERFNTEMNYYNLVGMLEFAKIDSMVNDPGEE